MKAPAKDGPVDRTVDRGRNGKPRQGRGEILDSPPPAALDSERALLSAVMTAGRIAPDVLLPSVEFYDERHQAIWQALVSLDGEDGRIDPAALLTLLRQDRRWGQHGLDSAYVIGEVATAGGAVTRQAWHAGEIHKAYIKRTASAYAETLLQETRGPGDIAKLQAVVKALSEVVSGQAGGKALDFRRISCAELDAATYGLEYLIDGALVAGQPCILAGGKKTLKTSLLIDLGISLAMGGCFLGRLKVNRACRVGIMTGESGLATVQETARRIAAAAGYRLADVSGLVFSEELPQFGSIPHQEALGRFIAADGLEVLAVDPAYMCIPEVDHANLFQVGERLRAVSEVCQETGALLLLAHHARKTKVDPFSPMELEDISWAGFQEFARQWLLVGRREAYQPGTGEHRLWLSAGGSAGHGGLWAVDIAEGTRETPGGRFWQANVMPADAGGALVVRLAAWGGRSVEVGWNVRRAGD